MPFNYEAQRLRADRMIARYGSSTAKLRRNGTDRACTVVEISYLPRDRNRISNPVERQVLLSSLAPDGTVLVAPDQELDSLVMRNPATGIEEELRLSQPVARLSPSTTVVFWDLRVEG